MALVKSGGFTSNGNLDMGNHDKEDIHNLETKPCVGWNISHETRINASSWPPTMPVVTMVQIRESPTGGWA